MITTPVMFHHFTDDVHPAGQGALDAVQLRAVLDRVGVERILRADEYLERVHADRLDPGSVCLTSDDNLRCQYDVALPVLTELGLTAFWFMYSSPLEGTVERLELYRYFRKVAYDSWRRSTGSSSLERSSRPSDRRSHGSSRRSIPHRGVLRRPSTPMTTDGSGISATACSRTAATLRPGHGVDDARARRRHGAAGRPPVDGRGLLDRAA